MRNALVLHCEYCMLYSFKLITRRNVTVIEARSQTFRGVLEAAIGDSLKKLRLKHKLLEPSCVNANISLLLLASLDPGGLGLLDLLLLAVECKQVMTISVLNLGSVRTQLTSLEAPLRHQLQPLYYIKCVEREDIMPSPEPIPYILQSASTLP